jgi:hypothetical protein
MPMGKDILVTTVAKKKGGNLVFLSYLQVELHQHNLK